MVAVREKRVWVDGDGPAEAARGRARQAEEAGAGSVARQGDATGRDLSKAYEA